MKIIKKVLKQKAIYWPLTDEDHEGSFDKFGKLQLDVTPIEIKVRWEDMQEEIIRPDGTTVVSKSKVMVSQDVKIGGFLMLGELCDVETFDDPRSMENVFEVVKFDKIPTICGTKFLRVAYL